MAKRAFYKGTSFAADRRQAKARNDRLAQISEGLLSEVCALNTAIKQGVEVRFPEREGSIASGKRVVRARYGFDGLWVETANYGGSFALANDDRWAALLQIAGLERDARAV